MHYNYGENTCTFLTVQLVRSFILYTCVIMCDIIYSCHVLKHNAVLFIYLFIYLF